MKLPFIKFYHSDWRGDPKLRVCSLAAQGLWIGLISIMAESEKYGYLQADGKPMALEDMATLIGKDKAEVKANLSELETRKVTSRTDDGILYSRRMARDGLRRSKAKEYGKQGGNPSLLYSLPEYKDILETRDYRERVGLTPLTLELLKNKDFYDKWADFCDHRKEIKCPLTCKAAKATLEDCATWGAVVACVALHNSVKNGWRGVFEPKQEDMPTGTLKNRKHAAAQSRQASKDALIAQYQRDILNCQTRDEAIRFVDKCHDTIKDVVAEGQIMDYWTKMNARMLT